MRYDVMIIGGGPGGYTAANKAGRNGLKTILFEKDQIGGTCLNRGCIPMKALIQSAHVYKDAKQGEMFGVLAENTSLDYGKVKERRDSVVSTLRGGIEKSLKANKVETVKGFAQIIDKDKISCNGEIYEGDHIIIAAGSIPAIPPIEGREFAITSDDVLEKDHQLKDSIIIIGGGVIGCEIADAFSGFGVKVTVIEMADRLLPTLDRELGTRLAMFFRKKGIDVICSAAVKKIGEDHSVTYTDKKGEEQTVTADEVLIATGRRANIASLVSEDFSLETGRGIVSDENGRTNVDSIYVIGDARQGNIQLAHVAEAQGENIIDLILGRQPSHDMSVIPSGVYTDPEIASVGIGEDELKEKGIAYQARKYLTGANGKCLIENSDSGFVKIITVDDVIVGGQIITPHATELIGELTVAVQKKLKVSELSEVVHPHPTISEMIWDAVKE
ncbi:MAG: dihydrolipoyl dehydrogenase [Erysipelotrichaceae bacterium]|nr:dihydrolipoyl dehydrogenase [Erysipelotrichaceae bacterium]